MLISNKLPKPKEKSHFFFLISCGNQCILLLPSDKTFFEEYLTKKSRLPWSFVQ